MKLAVIFAIIIGGGAVFIFGFLIFSGLFFKPEAVEKNMGPYFYAYEDFTGPYSKTMPVFQKVFDTLNSAEIKNTIGIGIYLDDPRVVAAENLRSKCGAVIDESDFKKAESLGLKTGSIEASKSIVIEFPARTPLSYMIGPRKCYPLLEEYIKTHNYPMGAPYEIYDIPNKKIYVVLPVGE